MVIEGRGFTLVEVSEGKKGVVHGKRHCVKRLWLRIKQMFTECLLWIKRDPHSFICQ